VTHAHDTVTLAPDFLLRPDCEQHTCRVSTAAACGNCQAGQVCPCHSITGQPRGLISVHELIQLRAAMVMSRLYFYEGVVTCQTGHGLNCLCMPPCCHKGIQDLSTASCCVKMHRREATQCWHVAGPAQVLCLCLPPSAPLLHGICCQGLRAPNIHEGRRRQSDQHLHICRANRCTDGRRRRHSLLRRALAQPRGGRPAAG